ncbi:MAG: beta-propeller fold lactonase family protein [Candidatus Babeliales bacterium]|jgi:WD40 repeat protein
MRKVAVNVFFVFSLFFTGLYFTLYSTSQDGTVTPKFQTVNNVFYDSEFARGFVRLANGFTVEKKTSGVGSTHGACVFMDTCVSVSGAIDLRETNTMFLQSDLILDHGVTFSSGGNIYGYDRALILNGDLTIPDGKIIHTGGRIVIDGNGHKLILGNSSQLFVDMDATLTLRNLVLQNTRNQPGHPAVQCASSGSKLCLDDVELALADDFYFNRGQMFVHNDVAVTGTSAFVYRSCQPSFITSDSKLYFDIGTTFSIAPATFTDCPYSISNTTTTNNFIRMADKTSQLYLDGCSLFTTLTGCRFTTGSLIFDNKIQFKSDAISDLASSSTTPVVFIHGISTGSASYSVSWSPDGRFVAVVNSGSNTLQIFSFYGTGYPNLVSSVSTDSSPYSVSWSPDGRFLAVANRVSNTLQVFSFYGSGSPILIGSASTGSGAWTLSWSPDGHFIAVVNSFGNALQIFKFLGFGNPILVGSVSTGMGSEPTSVSWSPDGRFLAVVNSAGQTLQIFKFLGLDDPILVGSVSTGTGDLRSVAWSPDGRFVAVLNYSWSILKIFKFSALGDPILVGSANTDPGPYSLSWSSGGRFLAILNYAGNTLQIFEFSGFGDPILVGGAVTAAEPGFVAWSPDERFIATINIGVSGGLLQIFGLNYVKTSLTQNLSNSIVFGNSALGLDYDLNVRVLAGAQVNLDGLLSCDNVN